MKLENKGVFFILISAFFYGVMAVFIRILSKEIPVFSQVFLRYIVASITAFIFAKTTKTILKMKTENDYLIMFFIGIFGYCLSTVFFTLAIIKTTLASTIFIFSTYVVITPLLAFILLKEKLSKLVITAIILSVTGTYLLFNPSGLNSAAGGFFALFAAFLNSLYFIGSRKLSRIISMSASP